MIYKVSHTTAYVYENFVNYCYNMAILKPRESNGQQLLEFILDIFPKPSEISERIDFFGNYVSRFSIQEQHNQLNVTTHSKILRDFSAYRETFFSELCKNITLEDALASLNNHINDFLEASQYILESTLIRKVPIEIKEYALISFHPKRSVFEAGVELMERIYHDFQFVPGITNVATKLNEVINERKGVCQDFAHIAIACIRSVGLPARYVSGYIETIPRIGDDKLTRADVSHAWFSIFIPGFGWVDFDPTNNQIPRNQHIVVAWGRDYYDVTPLKGVIYSNGKHKMEVAVEIKEIM